MSIPDSIGGLQLWMDSSDNTTITQSGSIVTGWTDKSGNNNSPTSITGSPNIATQYSNQYINFSSSRVLGPMSITTTRLSVFSVVIIPTAPINTFARIVSLGASGQLDYNNSAYAGLYVSQNTKNITVYRNGAVSTGSNSLSTPILAASIFDSSTGTVYVNGTAASSGSSAGNFGINTYVLGSHTQGLQDFFSGSIGEVLVYNTALTLSQRQLIEGHLAWKWGLNAQLPVAHPYYSVNPNGPISLVAAVTSTTASIAFTPPTGTIANYQYSTDNGATYNAFSPAQASSPVLISGLTNNTTYSIRLKAVDSNGTVSIGAGSVTTITTAATPAAPTGLAATAGYLSISLAFTPPSGTISNYRYSLNGGSYVAVSPAQTTSPIVISGLSATSYTITLQAVNGNGAGAASSSVSTTVFGYIPSSISGLQLWMDSSDNATITKSVTTLTGWTDKSGNNNSPTSITGSPSITTQYNNQYINFSNSRVLGPMSITTTRLSVFSVVIIPTTPAYYARIVSLGVPNTFDYNNSLYAGLFVYQNTKNITLYRNNTLVSTGSNSLSTPILAASIFDSLTGTTYVNGTAASSGSSTGTFGINTYALGAHLYGPTDFLSGSIGEVLIYNTALLLSQRQLIEGYLAWKWGFNTSLPSGHPYYSTNPIASSSSLPCFARGTRVLTQHGYKAIEMLEHNDYIVTPDSRVIDFKLFKTTVATTTKHTAPYLIQPHAFGRNVPSAPLRLSATHKIQLAEGLWTSPEKAALTNPLVTQCEIGAPVTYYHIECANYLKDNIVTEGMIVESLGTTKATGGKSDIYAWNSRLNAYTRVGHMDSPKSKSA